MRTVASVSHVPEIVGVASAIVAPAAGVLMTGTAGSVLSMVIATALLTGLRLPPTSVCVAVIVTGPWASTGELDANGLVTVQVAEQSCVAPLRTRTVAPGSHVPATFGVVSESSAPFMGAVITAASGAEASMFTVTIGLGTLRCAPIC